MYVLAVANGTTFGRGMKIAPDAKPDDGLFDVVLLTDASKFEVLKALNRVYKATHLSHPAVRHARAQTVKITGDGAPFGLELDGEVATAKEVTFEICPGMLQLLT
jgi:diacylglycerol kinase (ATP)